MTEQTAPPVVAGGGGEVPQGARVGASGRGRARAFYMALRSIVNPQPEAVERPSMEAVLDFIKSGTTVVRGIETDGSVMANAMALWLGSPVGYPADERPREEFFYAEDDPRYRPWTTPAEQWITESRALWNDARYRREQALASPRGVPRGRLLEDYHDHLSKLEDFYLTRAIHWEARLLQWEGWDVDRWRQGRASLGLEDSEPSPPPGEREAVIYRFYGEDGALLYIGQSIRLWERIQRHTEKDWFSKVASVTFERVPVAELSEREAEAIRIECPRYNVYHWRPSSDRERSRREQ